MKNVAIVLAAGSGKRMNSKVKKQYIEMAGHPVIYYALKTFQESFIQEIVMVVSPGDEEYCKKEIVEKYGFDKVTKIVPGGTERYFSVFEGLKACSIDTDYVFIHDGARAFVTVDVLERCLQSVEADRACVASVPVKDTIKVADGDEFASETLDRTVLRSIQTPQVFEYGLIFDCYKKLIESEQLLIDKGIKITDDAQAAELFSDIKVRLVMGSYDNIKVTTPEDISVGLQILAKNNK